MLDPSDVQVVLKVDPCEVVEGSTDCIVPSMSQDSAMKDFNSFKQTKLTKFFRKPNVVSVIAKNPYVADTSNPDPNACLKVVSNPVKQEIVSNPGAAACLFTLWNPDGEMIALNPDRSPACLIDVSNPGMHEPLVSNPGCEADDMLKLEVSNSVHGESMTGCGGSAMFDRVEARTNRKPGTQKHM